MQVTLLKYNCYNQLKHDYLMWHYVFLKMLKPYSYLSLGFKVFLFLRRCLRRIMQSEKRKRTRAFSRVLCKVVWTADPILHLCVFLLVTLDLCFGCSGWTFPIICVFLSLKIPEEPSLTTSACLLRVSPAGSATDTECRWLMAHSAVIYVTAMESDRDRWWFLPYLAQMSLTANNLSAHLPEKCRCCTSRQ